MPTTWNPSDKGSNITLSNGNLTVTLTAGNEYNSVRATVYKASGKWYWENTIQGQSGGIPGVGIATASANLATYIGADQYGWCWLNNGNVYNSGSVVASIGAFTVGDVLGVAFDADNHTIKFYKNNTLKGTVSSLPSSDFSPTATVHNALPYDQITANFGASTLAYTPPSGYTPLDGISFKPQIMIF